MLCTQIHIPIKWQAINKQNYQDEIKSFIPLSRAIIRPKYVTIEKKDLLR
jgi:hypothetical protein